MTRKPCPACKKIDRHREADSVCGDCQELLAIGAEVIRQRNGETDVTCINVPPANFPHWLPCSDGDVAKHLSALLHAANLGHREKSKHEDIFKGGSRYSGWDWIYVKDGVANAARELTIAIEKAIKDERKRGNREGKQFIRQLAAGEVSLSELQNA